MQIVGSISIEQVQDLSLFKYGHGSQSHLLIPIGFIAFVILTLFALEYYKDWRRRRRLNRILEKSGRAQK